MKPYLASIFADAMFFSETSRETSTTLCLSSMYRALPRTNTHTSVFRTCKQCQKVAMVSSCTKTLAIPTRGKSERWCLMLSLFFGYFSTNDKIWNFEKLSVFLEYPIDFQEWIWYSYDGRHECRGSTAPPFMCRDWNENILTATWQKITHYFHQSRAAIQHQQKYYQTSPGADAKVIIRVEIMKLNPMWKWLCTSHATQHHAFLTWSQTLLFFLIQILYTLLWATVLD